jgi:hypothetical protein
MPPLTSADIDDANLLYYYTTEQTLYGPYYRLNQTKEGFPAGFYGSERPVQFPDDYVHSNLQYRDAGRGQTSTAVETGWASKVVSQFRIVAHTMGPVVPGGELSQNHWTIYMLTSTGSVQLNMQLANTDTDRGKLVVKEHAYISSNTAVQFWDIAACPNVRAGRVYDLILTKGRQNYNMAEGGVGCRWWV